MAPSRAPPAPSDVSFSNTVYESTTASRPSATGPITNSPILTRAFSMCTDEPMLTPSPTVNKSGTRSDRESISTSRPTFAPSARRYAFRSGVPANRYTGASSHSMSASHHRKYVMPHNGYRPGRSRLATSHLPAMATPNDDTSTAPNVSRAYNAASGMLSSSSPVK